jgi:sugar phosphate isomerase/epimerase
MSERRLLFGTTSYVLPDDLLPNARLLTPLVEDIELILFEGEASNLPSQQDVAELRRLAEAGGGGYTVHLPLDVGLGELERRRRREAQDITLRVMDLTLPLEPHAFVVHPELPLSYHPKLGEEPQPLDELPPELEGFWQEALGESLERLAELAGPFPVAVENLQFPFVWVKPLLEQFDLGVTLDVGHLLKAGGNVRDHLTQFGDRLTVVHLHGIIDGCDHRDLSAYDEDELRDLLESFRETGDRRPAMRTSAAADRGPGEPLVVDLEVFGWRPTVPSLRLLSAVLDDDQQAAALREAANAVMELVPRYEKASG